MGLFSFKKKKQVPNFPRFPGAQPGTPKPEFPSYESEFGKQNAPQKIKGMLVEEHSDAGFERPNLPFSDKEALQPPQRMREQQQQPPVEHMPPIAHQQPQMPTREPGFLRQQHEEQAVEPMPPARPRMPPPSMPPEMARQQQQPMMSQPPQQQQPMRPQQLQPIPRGQAGNQLPDQPVFVKLEQYREAMQGIEMIKQKIKEAEYTLDRLNDVRSKEEAELKSCHASLDNIKEKLLTIDKMLFEI